MRTALSWFTIAFAWAAAAGAVELATNGTFDGSLAGWSDAGGLTTYDGGLDATGTPGSGSAHQVRFFSVPSSGYVVSQCIVLGRANFYRYGGKIYVPGGQSGSAAAVISATWWSNDDCTGTWTYESVNADMTITDEWQTLASRLELHPFETRSVLLAAQQAGGPTNTRTVSVDDLTLIPMATIEVPALGVPAAALLTLGLAALGVLALRRLRA
jgi:hypothetical protein